MNLGVEILGKQLDPILFKRFESLDEMILSKNNMALPRSKKNVPIRIEKSVDRITISGRLYKSGRIAHDPNIGALTLISQGLRSLGWDKEIVITQHGLKQDNVGKNNKFVQIANQIGIELEGLVVPNADLSSTYWRYEVKSEKLVTIFMHLVVEEFTQAHAIYDNHAGGEMGYFRIEEEQETEYIVLEKYEDRDAYKAGDKSKNLPRPDLILFDGQRDEVINIEGKKFENRKKGIEQLKTYDAIE